MAPVAMPNAAPRPAARERPIACCESTRNAGPGLTTARIQIARTPARSARRAVSMEESYCAGRHEGVPVAFRKQKGEGPMMKSLPWLAALALLATPLAHANLFKCADKSGKVTYQETPCTGADSEKRLQAPEAGPQTLDNAAKALGWDPVLLNEIRHNCSRETVDHVRQKWLSSGDKRPFPAAEVRRTLSQYCDCLVSYVRRMPAREVARNPEVINSLIFDHDAPCKID